MTGGPIPVYIFGLPDAACGQGMTWSAAAAYVRRRLQNKFGDAVTLDYIEIFSARCFDFPEVIERLQAGGKPPIVLVGGQFVDQGSKISEPVLRDVILSRLSERRPGD